MKKLILINLIIIISLALLFTGCFKPDCPAPDGSKITVHRGTTATGGMIIHGAEGAVAPGATVTITDKDGNTVTTTADANGSFTLLEADLPMDFDHTLENNISVTQKSEGCNESPAVDVEIEF